MIIIAVGACNMSGPPLNHHSVESYARMVSSYYRRMDKDVARIYHGILLSHKEELLHL